MLGVCVGQGMHARRCVRAYVHPVPSPPSPCPSLAPGPTTRQVPTQAGARQVRWPERIRDCDLYVCVCLGRARPLAVEWVVLHTGNIRAHTPARMHALTDTDPQHSGMYPPKATRTRTLSYTRARILAPPTKARSTYTSSLVVGVNLCVCM